MNEPYVVVIGGLNMDIAGLCGPVYHPKDSNIGNIKISVGGVGQNIAQNLAHLEVPTQLITVYGDDHFGKILTQECLKNNIKLDQAACIKDMPSSTYLYTTDNTGDMVTAINDMKIVEAITPEFLAERKDFINNATICVIDGNISEESIKWLAKNVSVPIFVDPVSMVKCERFKDVLDKINTFKPNELEAELLTGIKITDESSAKAAAQALINKGVKNVFISLGEAGILCANAEGAEIIPIIKVPIVSCNGAGDCTMATIIWAAYCYHNALPLSEVGLLTQAAASIAVQSEEAVSPELNIREIIKRAQAALQPA